MDKLKKKIKIKRKVSHQKKQELLEKYHSESEEFSDSDGDQLDDLEMPLEDQEVEDEPEDAGMEEADGAEEEQKPKTNKMSNAISKILNQKSNDKRPVLSLRKRIELDIDQRKLQQKTQKRITLDKKTLQNIGRKIPNDDNLNYEKQLRKLGTKGVVQLFNALLQAQRKEKEKEPTETKKTFLDALKNGETLAEKVVPFLKNDYSLDAPKHWDQSDGDN